MLSSIDLGSTYYILIDVDNFKEVNDTLGHETGDKVLQKVASAIRQQFRSDRSSLHLAHHVSDVI